PDLERLVRRAHRGAAPEPASASRGRPLGNVAGTGPPEGGGGDGPPARLRVRHRQLGRGLCGGRRRPGGRGERPRRGGGAGGLWESVVAPLRRPRHREVARTRLALTPQPSTPGLGLWARSPNGTSVLDWACGIGGIALADLESALESAGRDPAPVLMVPHLSG